MVQASAVLLNINPTAGGLRKKAQRGRSQVQETRKVVHFCLFVCF